jgi:glycine betaine/proline transport system ATP-binding protein
LQNGRIIQTGTAEDIVMAPADDYVAEFVRHMNPLDVLTGAMIMQQRLDMPGDAGSVWLDERRRYQLQLNSQDQAVDLRLDGLPHGFNHVRGDGSDGGGAVSAHGSVAIAPASLSLHEIIRLRQLTGHPVLLAEEGRILGVCGEVEIIRALAGSRNKHAGPGG